MSALISVVHVAYVTASVIALIGVSTILLRAAERTSARSTAIVTVGGIALWYGIASVGGFNNAFVGKSTDLVAPIVFGLVPPLAIGLVALWLSAPLRRVLSDGPTAAAVIAVQGYRMVGGGFLLLMALGQLPAIFAIPAGVGDLLVGLTAGGVAARVAAGDRRVGITWNLLGVLDLAIALLIGLTAAPGVAHLILTEPTTAAVTLAPLVIVPAFLVPLSLWLHAVSLRSLLARGVRARTAFRREAA
jgi:hypothetical protein